MHYRTRRRLESFFHTLDVTRRVLLGILFWSIVILVLMALIGSRPSAVKKGSILVLHPRGTLVDVFTEPTTYQGLPVSGFPNETLLSDMVGALSAAGKDDRIAGVWLYLDDLYSAGPASAAELAEAVRGFRNSGKPVMATADTFDTARYRIAAPADSIVVDRLGEVFPSGYGSWRAYYADGLEKFGVQAELFRSGESKSGAENFIFNGMSETALRNEQRLLGDLWNGWLENVAEDRGLNAGDLDRWVQNYDSYLLEADGDGSRAALDAGLVDDVEDGDTAEKLVSDLLNGDSVFLQSSQPPRIDSSDYLRHLRRPPGRKASVAVVPVSGTLSYGPGSSGTAGSTDIVSAIEAARDTPGVQAMVIRIDSPGGDVRAGETIRRALQETRESWNLPIVVSMGDMAASGGYWIAVESDLILASEETITGSIGVYSLSLTFERALSQWLGVRIDGWGTTPWSGAGHPGRALDERTSTLYEAGVRDIDTLFRTLVAGKRNLDDETVNSLAGGIPWSGRRALENGLADRTGGLSDAIVAAAELAQLQDPQVLLFDMRANPGQEMLGRLLWGRNSVARPLFGTGMIRGYRPQPR